MKERGSFDEEFESTCNGCSNCCYQCELESVQGLIKLELGFICFLFEHITSEQSECTPCHFGFITFIYHHYSPRLGPFPPAHLCPLLLSFLTHMVTSSVTTWLGDYFWLCLCISPVSRAFSASPQSKHFTYSVFDKQNLGAWTHKTLVSTKLSG